MRTLSNTQDRWNEGWDIFFTGNNQSGTHNKYELQAVGEVGAFKDDNEAINFVVDEAIKNPKGDHANSLLFLAEESPNEIDSIVRSAIGVDKFTRLKNVMRYTAFDQF